MACSITISNVNGTVVSGTLTSIQVSGTSSGCDQIQVTVNCHSTNIQQTVFNTNGIWTAIFSAADAQTAHCFCSKAMVVTAQCVNPATAGCSDTKTVQVLPCSPPCCHVQLSQSVAGTCIGGLRPVTWSAVNGCTVTTGAQLDYGDGSPIASLSMAPGATQNLTHNYAPGTYTAILHIPGCPDRSITVTVLPCCPTIQLNVQPGSCRSDGTKPVTITAVLTPPPGGVTIHAELVEGTTVLASGTSSSPSSVLTLAYSGNFASGSHTVCVQTNQPAGCAMQCTTFDVNCIGACCMPDGVGCKDGLTQDQCQSQGGTYMGNGTTCADVVCKCTQTFRKWLCPLLMILMTFLTAIGYALLLLSLCIGLGSVVNGIAGAMLATGIVALILFWIFCAKCLCGWFYLFLWRVLFGVGIIVAVFSKCCSSFTWPAIASMLIGIVFLFIWKKHCKKTLCELLKEVILVMAGYILPLIGTVLGWSALANCQLVVFSFSYSSTFHVTFFALVLIVFGAVTTYDLLHCQK